MGISFRFPSMEAPFQHVWGLAFPPTKHVTLEQDYLDKFQEIFVIGDVHGCLDELEELLVKADALTDKVLKIFVGDLVNKGPKSREVLNFVRSMPSALSVRGNHEEVVLRNYNESKDPQYKMPKKTIWIKDLSEEDINYLHSLPYTISLPSLKAIIVHAGLVPGTKLEQMHPTALVTMRNVIFKEGDGCVATKSRKEGIPWAQMWLGPEHVYFGHDARRELQRHTFATGLDTGCVNGTLLTGTFIKGPRTGVFVSVEAKKAYREPKSHK